MTTVPLGRGAYERKYSGAPVIELLNRWVESNPANPREGTSVIGRPGTTLQETLNSGDYNGLGAMRGNFTLSGLMDDSLFVVCGTNLYRITKDMTVIHIQGTVNGSPGQPEVAWQKGAGYERLWISDGLLLQYYGGTTGASGHLTKSGSIVNGTDKFEVNGVYYVWGTSFSGLDDGTTTHPFVVNPTSTGSTNDPMGQLVLAVNNAGTPGVDYSGTIAGPNTAVGASVDAVPGTVVTLTANTPGTGGNSITFSVVGGAALTASGTGHLANGGIDALQGCTMPDGVSPLSLTQVSSYVMVSVADSQRFYWINPGEIVIDPLNFAAKESSPDNIISMRAVGDQVLIMGEKSTENWYATGNLAAPFAPIEGRVYARGVIAGTPVVIDDGVILVGDDGRVYTIGFQPGDATDAAWGVNRISNNGIEERIRYLLREEGGLTP